MSSAATSVGAVDVDAATAARLAAVWASLPETLRPTGRGEVVAVGGSTTDWPVRVAVAARAARAVVLLDPVPVPADDVRSLAAEVTVPVLVRTPWISPTVARFRESFGAELPGWVRSVVHHTPGRRATAVLLDQLALVRAAVGPVTAVHHARLDEHGHLIVGEAGERTVHLQGVRTAVPGLARLSVLGADREYTLELPPPGTARPGLARADTADGTRLAPPIHEDGDRALWRRAAAGGPGGLAALAADLDVLQTLPEQKGPTP